MTQNTTADALRCSWDWVVIERAVFDISPVVILSRPQLTKDRWLIATWTCASRGSLLHGTDRFLSLSLSNSVSLCLSCPCRCLWRVCCVRDERKMSVWRVSWCTAAPCQRTLRSAFRSAVKLTPVCLTAAAWSWFWRPPVNTSTLLQPSVTPAWTWQGMTSHDDQICLDGLCYFSLFEPTKTSTK